ncbi:MAG: peptidylprolyl isomerase [Actinomycetota bacterium]|nr:peptidylprolyl isomerase [Actinomycetota bacterium]
MTAGVIGAVVVVVALAMIVSLLPPRTSPVADQTTPGVACGGQVPAAAGQDKPRFDEPPDLRIDPTADYRATIATSCGDVIVDLYEDQAPRTVNNFVFLAEQGFYDGLTFHRVVPGFVVQGGGPAGDGTGGPGYRFEDELELARTQGYAPGAVAMANSGPDTNGSQFFIVLPGGADALQPQYNLFGHVVDGMDAVQRIAEVPLAGQSPLEQVYIEDVTIEAVTRSPTDAASPTSTTTGT